MGNQSNNTAVFAVILVALILLLFIGGAVVVLGGLLFFASSDMATQQVVVSSDYATMPVETITGMAIASPVIHLDSAGQIMIDGQVYSPEELRTHLEQQVEDYPSDIVTPQLQAAPDCPEEVRAEVIAICEDVTGNTPQLVVSAASIAPAPLEPLDSTGENSDDDE